MRALMLPFLFVLAACSNGGDGSADMAGASCTSIGAVCVATGVGGVCPAGSRDVDPQVERYCGSNVVSCCLAECPTSASDALGKPCDGPRTCEYATTCEVAVCQSQNGTYSWFAYTGSCP